MATIYTPRQQRILVVASLLVIGVFIFLGLRSYATAFLSAGVLYVVFRPWFGKLVHEKKWNRRLVTILLMLFSLLVIILPFVVLSLLLVDRIRFYSENYGEILKLVQRVEEATGLSIANQLNVQSLVKQGGAVVSKQFSAVLGSTLDFAIIIGLLYFSLYFMFMAEEAFLKGLRKYLPFERDTLDELGTELKNMVNANVLGQALVALVQGILTGLTLWIFGISDAAFWGTVAFFLAFIPILGTPLVWVPAALITLSQGNTGQGVGILVVGVVVLINVDNLLRIVLAKRMGDIHPLITLVGIVLGVPLFGIIGLVIGPLLLSYFVLLMQVFERQNRGEKRDLKVPDSTGPGPRSGR